MTDPVNVTISLDMPVELFREVFLESSKGDVISAIKRYSREFDKDAFCNTYCISIASDGGEMFNVGDTVYYVWSNHVYKGHISAILDDGAFRIRYRDSNRVVFKDRVAKSFDELVECLKSDIHE